MKYVISNIIESLHNNPGGFSARKLSALYCLIVGMVVTFKFGNSNNSVELTIIWVLAAFLFLGIITFQQITDFKNGTKVTKENKTTVVQTQTEIKKPE